MSSHHMPSKQARFEVKRYRKALLIEVMGLFTRDTGRSIRELFKLAHDVERVDRILVDLRGAVILLAGDELELYEKDVIADPAVKRPCGILILPEQAEAILGHCEKMRQLGMVRAPFLDQAQALRWARLPPTALDSRATLPERRSMPWLQPPQEPRTLQST